MTSIGQNKQKTKSEELRRELEDKEGNGVKKESAYEESSNARTMFACVWHKIDIHSHMRYSLYGFILVFTRTMDDSALYIRMAANIHRRGYRD